MTGRRRWLTTCLGAAFAARCVKGLIFDRPDWGTRYVDFWQIAQSVAHGGGLYVSTRGEFAARYAAYRPPLYPLLLALTIGDSSRIAIITLQAAFGAGTVLLAFLIARELSDELGGLLAAAATAVYPYYVWHDTVLQETSLFTLLVAASAYTLLTTNKTASMRRTAIGGVLVGLAILTRSTILPFVGLVAVWLAFVPHQREPGARRRPHFGLAAAFLGAVLVTVSPWLVRNTIVLGWPVINSQSDRFLWIGNNALTFSYYPTGHIDQSRDAGYAAFDPAEKSELKALLGDELGEAAWFRRKGLAYIRQHPIEVLRGAAIKLVTAFSPVLSPVRGAFEQSVYFLSYFPILSLGGWGLVRFRRRWNDVFVLYALFASFVVGTAIFWAHTGHRTYLDVYLIVLAACVARPWLSRMAAWREFSATKST